MIVTLHQKQRVSASSRIIRFHHQADSGRRHEVELNDEQFENLNDVIVSLDKYHSVRYFPLGEGLYLYRTDTTSKLIDSHRHTFFWFYHEAWHFYITHVHTSLYNFFRSCHGNTYRNQSYAKRERGQRNSSRRSSSFLSNKYKTLSRPSRNGRHDIVKRTQHTNVSRRCSTDSRMRVRHTSRKHASRMSQQIAADQHDTTLSSVDMDSVKSCDEYSVGEASLSPQDQID